MMCLDGFRQKVNWMDSWTKSHELHKSVMNFFLEHFGNADTQLSLDAEVASVDKGALASCSYTCIMMVHALVTSKLLYMVTLSYST